MLVTVGVDLVSKSACWSSTYRDGLLLPHERGDGREAGLCTLHVKLLGLHVPRMVLAALAPPHTGDLRDRHTL